jgi:hypothetical protein
MRATCADCGLEVVRPQTQSPRTKESFLFPYSRSFLPRSEMNFAETITGSPLLSRASTPLVLTLEYLVYSGVFVLADFFPALWVLVRPTFAVTPL